MPHTASVQIEAEQRNNQSQEPNWQTTNLDRSQTGFGSRAFLDTHLPAESQDWAAVHAKPLHEPKQIVSFFFFLYMILAAQELHVNESWANFLLVWIITSSLNVTHCVLLQQQLPSKTSWNYVQSSLSGAPPLPASQRINTLASLQHGHGDRRRF